MRAKEFIMKDAYSFDATDERRDGSYQKMYDAYTRIFQRCGLKTIAGRSRHRRHGRQFFARIHGAGGDRARMKWFIARPASMRRTSKRRPASGAFRDSDAPDAGAARRKNLPTPGVVTIDALAAAPHNVAAHRQIKTLFTSRTASR